MTNNDNLEKIYFEFVSTISHELRTPLTSIRGFAQTLRLSYDRLSDEQKKQFLLIIENQSNRLIKLVENLLQLAQSNVNEGHNLVFKNLKLEPFLIQTIDIFKMQYKNYYFELNCDRNLYDVFTDADRLQQVVVNLLENAVKYSKEFTRVSVFALNLDNQVSIRVIDEGVGIRPEDCEKVFEKFVRIENPLTSKTNGSGLGLYICKEIVKSLRGKIFCKSREKGSEFEVLLPISKIELPGLNKIRSDNNNSEKGF